MPITSDLLICWSLTYSSTDLWPACLLTLSYSSTDLIIYWPLTYSSIDLWPTLPLTSDHLFYSPLTVFSTHLWPTLLLSSDLLDYWPLTDSSIDLWSSFDFWPTRLTFDILFYWHLTYSSTDLWPTLLLTSDLLFNWPLTYSSTDKSYCYLKMEPFRTEESGRTLWKTIETEMTLDKTCNELRWLAQNRSEWRMLVCAVLHRELRDRKDTHEVDCFSNAHRIEDNDYKMMFRSCLQDDVEELCWWLLSLP